MSLRTFLFSILLSYAVLMGFLAPQSVASEVGLICTHIDVKAPPFFVVPTGFDPATDHLPSSKDNVNYTTGVKSSNHPQRRTDPADKPWIVPKRSIVRVSEDYREVIERTGRFAKSAGDQWINVKVVSLPPENRQLQRAQLDKTRRVAAPLEPSEVQTAKVNDEGFIKISSLERLENQKDYSFVVTQDTEMFRKLHQELTAQGYRIPSQLVLRLKRNGDLYTVRKCCKAGTQRCANYPIFEFLNLKNNRGENVRYEKAELCYPCLTALTPVHSSFLDPILSVLSHPSLGLNGSTSPYERASTLSDLNFVDTRGFMQIPVSNGTRGPFNSEHYSPESGDADLYLKPDVTCGFMQFLKKWDETCQGRQDCRIRFGDASHAFHKGCTTTGNRCSEPWPHTQHTHGECIDIGVSHMSRNNGYRNSVGVMMEMLKKLGPSTCLSTDGDINRNGCSFDSTRAHDNHMHICFKSNVASSTPANPKLKQACESGL